MTDNELTKENTMSIVGFVWDTRDLPDPDTAKELGLTGWRPIRVLIKKSDLEEMGWGNTNKKIKGVKT